MQKVPLNFSPLQSIKPVKFPGYYRKNLMILSSYLSIMIAVLLLVMGLDLIIVLLLLILIITCVLFVSAEEKSKEKHNELLVSQFAKINNFSYETKGEVYFGSGIIYNSATEKTFHNRVSGTISNFPFKFYEYRYSTATDGGKKSHNVVSFEVELPRVLPQFVIDSEMTEVIPIEFDKSQKIELEGEFHKYFNLYAPDKYGISALTILAPDAMEVLLNHAAHCDIEVVKDRLYFYWAGVATKQEDYQKIFNTVTAVLDKIGSRLTDKNIFADASQAKIHASPAAKGERLKSSNIGTATIVVLAIVIGAAQFNEALSRLLTITIILSVFAFLGIHAYKQNKLNEEYKTRLK